MSEFPEINRETGTVSGPADESKVMRLRKYPALKPAGFTVTVTGVAGPALRAVGTPLTESQLSAAVTEAMSNSNVPEPMF
jgi:hypothetical protein